MRTSLNSSSKLQQAQPFELQDLGQILQNISTAAILLFRNRCIEPKRQQPRHERAHIGPNVKICYSNNGILSKYIYAYLKKTIAHLQSL